MNTIVKNGVILYSNAEIINGAIHANGVIDNVTTDYEVIDIEGAEIGDLFDGVTLTKKVKQEPIEVPQSITPRQARLSLLQSTLLDEVEMLLANDRAMQIWWEYSLEIERNHPHINSMALALNITIGQLDELFILGASL